MKTGRRTHPCRFLLSIPLLALATTHALAQTRAPSDPITGVWSGWIGETAANPHAIRFEISMKSDGTLTGSAGGPQLTPGVIESGTFDRATGALQLTVVVREAQEVADGGRVKLEGRVVNDTAAGAVILRGQRGVFQLVRETPGAASTAPVTPKGDAGVAVRRGLVEVSDWITRAAEMVPADRYSYRPVGTVRTFGQLLAHVIDGSNYYCGRATGRRVEWSDATEKTVEAKAALVQALAKSLADCKAVYEGASEIGPMMENLVHNGLHYGNMVTYLRMMGLTPPSS